MFPTFVVVVADFSRVDGQKKIGFVSKKFSEPCSGLFTPRTSEVRPFLILKRVDGQRGTEYHMSTPNFADHLGKEIIPRYFLSKNSSNCSQLLMQAINRVSGRPKTYSMTIDFEIH